MSARKISNTRYQFRVGNHLPMDLIDWLKDPKALPIRAYEVQDEQLRHYDPLDIAKYDGWEGDLVNQ